MNKKLRLFLFGLIFPFISYAQGFKIVGNELHDANGKNFIIKGINVPLAWFVADVNGNIENIKKNTNANTLRIVVQTATADADWQKCVENCIASKIIPMVELHDVTGKNSPDDLQRMAEFWASKASFITKPEIAPYILVNIANEWGDWYMSSPSHEPSQTVWRDAYISAVQTIRTAGIKTTIVVDAPGYGQDNKSSTLLNYAKEVQAADVEKNVLFSLHLYCEWGVGKNSSIASDLPAVKAAGIPVMIGEFGFQHSETGGTCDIDEELIMNTAEKNEIGWLAWSWKGNSQGVEYLDLSKDWSGTTLSPWGNTVVNGSYGTKTAVEASVFDGITGTGEMEMVRSVYLYQEGASENIFITFPDNYNRSVNVYNAAGILQKSFKSNDRRLQINTSELAAGIYSVRIMDDRELIVKKFSKTN